MDEKLFLKRLNEIQGIVAISEFGSYKTEYWIEGRSDIDLIVITKPEITFIDTLNIEDKIIEISKEFYNYDKIHLTFVLFKEFASKFARFAVDSERIFIVDEEKWYDFQHYVLKYVRNNERLERILKIDEQYSYFGGIIDESLL